MINLEVSARLVGSMRQKFRSDRQKFRSDRQGPGIGRRRFGSDLELPRASRKDTPGESGAVREGWKVAENEARVGPNQLSANGAAGTSPTQRGAVSTGSPRGPSLRSLPSRGLLLMGRGSSGLGAIRVNLPPRG